MNLNTLQNHYLDLMLDFLTGRIFKDPSNISFLKRSVQPSEDFFIGVARENGFDFPKTAYTMIGVKRMKNIRALIEKIITDDIEGDFIETGVWKGGACIFMRAILAAYDITNRNVWLADSFQGLPKADLLKYPADEWADFSSIDDLKIDQEQVKSHFDQLRLLDDQVKFLKGWFKDTLHKAPIQNLALIRLDGDMYESTMDSLQALYPKLSNGGYVIVDDYNLPPCRNAIHDFFQINHIDPNLIPIDNWSVYWQKIDPSVSVTQKKINHSNTISDTLLASYMALNKNTIQKLEDAMANLGKRNEVMYKKINSLTRHT